MSKTENVKATQGERQSRQVLQAGERKREEGGRERSEESGRRGGEDDGAQKQAPSESVLSALCAADMTLSTGLC